MLGAYINLGRCFDLTDVWATSKLGESYEDLKRTLKSAGAPLPLSPLSEGPDSVS